MSLLERRAATLALLRRVGLEAPGIAERIESDGAVRVLAEHLGAGMTLLPDDPAPLLSQALRAIEGWRREGIGVVTVGSDDEEYPPALRTVHDRPAMLFTSGDAETVRNPDAIAIVGSRQAGADGLARSERFATEIVRAGHPVISGLAGGIDAAAHRAAIAAGGQTIAVIGNGLGHVYPAANAALQHEIASEHALVSPFEPDARPSPAHLRRRNGVMSGLALGTVIIEASARSGTRVQARLGLAHGRPVFLHRTLGTLEWAAALARRPGVHVVDTADDVLTILARSTGTLTGPIE